MNEVYFSCLLQIKRGVMTESLRLLSVRVPPDVFYFFPWSSAGKRPKYHLLIRKYIFTRDLFWAESSYTDKIRIKHWWSRLVCRVRSRKLCKIAVPVPESVDTAFQFQQERLCCLLAFSRSPAFPNLHTYMCTPKKYMCAYEKIRAVLTSAPH